jgi:hypothetical protein
MTLYNMISDSVWELVTRFAVLQLCVTIGTLIVMAPLLDKASGRVSTVLLWTMLGGWGLLVVLGVSLGLVVVIEWTFFEPFYQK